MDARVDIPVIQPAVIVPTTRSRRWAGQRIAALLTLGLGATTFVVLVLLRREIWAAADLRIGAPAVALTVVSGAVALARREPGKSLVIAGIALAVTGLVFGILLEALVILAIVAALCS